MAENQLTQSVYVIKATTGVVKIGISLDPGSRLRSFITGNPHGLTLEYSESFQFDSAAAIEKMVHGLLAEHHENGEWFRIDAEKAVATVKLASTAVEKNRAEMYAKAMKDTPEKVVTVHVEKPVYVEKTVQVSIPVETQKSDAYHILMAFMTGSAVAFGVGMIAIQIIFAGISSVPAALLDPSSPVIQGSCMIIGALLPWFVSPNSVVREKIGEIIKPWRARA